MWLCDFCWAVVELFVVEDFFSGRTWAGSGRTSAARLELSSSTPWGRWPRRPLPGGCGGT